MGEFSWLRVEKLLRKPGGDISFSICKNKYYCLPKCQAAPSDTPVWYWWDPVRTVSSRDVDLSPCPSRTPPWAERAQRTEWVTLVLASHWCLRTLLRRGHSREADTVGSRIKQSGFKSQPLFLLAVWSWESLLVYKKGIIISSLWGCRINKMVGVRQLECT